MEASYLIRLDKFLANMGVGTRKEVKKLISCGKVSINGAIIKDSGLLINESIDEVAVEERIVSFKPFVYIMMNKPAGVLSASEDSKGALCATDLLSSEYRHYNVSPAGRLDKDSEGFLLLTNDGEYIHNVITPNKHVNKKYYCILEKTINDEDIKAFEEGISFMDGTICMPAKLERIENDDMAAFVTIQEGKFHQVKKMFLARENKVLYLKRVQIGSVSLDEALEAGMYREMTEEEKESIFR